MRNSFRLACAALLTLSMAVMAGEGEAQSCSESKAAAEMEMLHKYAGKWEVKPTWKTPDGTMADGPIMSAVITNILGGQAQQELVDGEGFQLQITRTYDQQAKLYRFTTIDSTAGAMQVYQGRMEGEQLITDNLKTGTAGTYEGQVVHARMIARAKDDNHFTLVYETSKDKGATWEVAASLEYTRQNQQAAVNH